MGKVLTVLLICLAGLLSACVSVQLRPTSETTTLPGGSGAGIVDAAPTPTPFQPHTEAVSKNDSVSSPATADDASADNQAPGSSESTTAAQPPPTMPAPIAMPDPPTNQLTIWIDPNLPEGLHEALTLPPDLSLWGYENADLQMKPGIGSEGDGNIISSWIYALVAPFPTLPQGVAAEHLQRCWNGDPAGPFAGKALLMDEHTNNVFRSLWGEPAAGVVEIIPGAELLDQAWSRGHSWAIVPFETLEPRWKVLEVDGQSPLRKGFDPSAYPLTVPISLTGAKQVVEAMHTLYGPTSDTPLAPTSNRDPDRMTVLAMTGVTALVRATAYAMEQRGVLYPGKDVRDWLRAADLTHISNEVPFAKNCPYPNPVQPDMRFCSDPRYIALLEDVDTDIVELTGDHFADWGVKAMKTTLEMYRERGWYYYGGGANLKEARQPITVEHNGNRLAFIGCNAKGLSFAQAGKDTPGAAACDMDWMVSEIARLRDEGYLPVVTFQHYEYYTYQAQKPQKRDFRAAADAGAVIVSGSQAHQPQALEFSSDALIHYGLGNLFFDQYEISYPTRQGFIDRHVFYNERHISTELLAILFIDYARPRPMTPQERVDLLNSVFSASGW